MTKFFFKPTVQEQRTMVWRPVVVLGAVFLVASMLRVYMWLRPPEVPTATVPAVAWEDVSGESTPTSALTPTPTHALPPSPTPNTPPTSVNLAVPFTSQASLGVWDLVTEETCEEASLIMVQAYYAGIATLAANDMDTQMRAMASAEEQAGLGVSISATEMQAFAQTYAGATLRIVENPSVEDLKALLSAGHPVIIPAYGRKLGNPFFTGEGPLYHMLVLRGYTETMFITNDPGTRHGENYQYSYETLLEAIGDWDGDSPDGGARVLVLEP